MITPIDKIKAVLKRIRDLNKYSEEQTIAMAAANLGISEELVREADEREEAEA